MVEIVSDSSYIRQIGKRWGLKAPRQLLRMFRLHRTPFTTILSNIFSALEEVDGQFAFPTIASIASMQPDLVREIVKEGHEIASHGYNHVRYPSLTPEGRERDLRLSLQTFRHIGIKIEGFRAPYDNYTADMPVLLDQTRLSWDGGFGYRPEHREKNHFFHEDVGGAKSKVTYIPLNVWSDDLMIDGMGMSPEKVTETLKAEIEKAARVEGLVMFDLHPIRMGQGEYVRCIKEIVEYAHSLNGWCTTPTKAVKYWNKYNRWKSNSTFCLLLTGDIDNWVFSDYLRRVFWRRQMK